MLEAPWLKEGAPRVPWLNELWPVERYPIFAGSNALEFIAYEPPLVAVVYTGAVAAWGMLVEGYPKFGDGLPNSGDGLPA